jgi:AraC-like DNA-binding protein
LNGRDTSAPVSKGHLNPGASPPIARYAPPADLRRLVRHFWIPEWDLPAGRTVAARTLSYPALNLVIEGSSLILVGPATNASERVLAGRGWAVGVLHRPAATLALGYDASRLVDTLQSLDEPEMCERVAAVMSSAGPAEQRHVAAIGVVSDWLRDRVTDPGERGELANQAVDLIEHDPAGTRVADLARQLDVTPRTLQRAVRRCTGFTPAEVIRRYRLQDAATRLAAEPDSNLSTVAAEVGFADHAHMTRSFRRSLRETPSTFRTRS